MPTIDRNALLRALPSVEETLRSDAAGHWFSRLPRERVAELVRCATSGVRADLLASRSLDGKSAARAVTDRVDLEIDRLGRSSLRPVINASGVILHTNLGRAPLGNAAVQSIGEVAASYNTLEYDTMKGGRGNRDEHCGGLLERLLGAPALVVNNNAAAIFLAAHELARDGRVVVSRGELVEIGDGFRIRDILAASQAQVCEVGATNRTHLDDYRQALGPEARALLRVHPSNFRQIGFTGRPTLAELGGLARSAAIPLVEDLGSGCLADLREVGIEDEPTVERSLQAGVSLVTFSGDKLLGGPQAGILAGEPKLITRLRRNPLFRALRVDKLTLAALGATLRDYLAGRLDAIPVLRMMRIPEREMAVRAKAFVARLGLSGTAVIEGESLLGGGSTPLRALPTRLVAIPASGGSTVHAMERQLRSRDPAVVARIERDTLLFDLRTVADSDEEELARAIRGVAGLDAGG